MQTVHFDRGTHNTLTTVLDNSDISGASRMRHPEAILSGEVPSDVQRLEQISTDLTLKIHQNREILLACIHECDQALDLIAGRLDEEALTTAEGRLALQADLKRIEDIMDMSFSHARRSGIESRIQTLPRLVYSIRNNNRFMPEETITQVDKLEEIMNKALIRGDIVRIIDHDMRTPLGNIAYGLNLLGRLQDNNALTEDNVQNVAETVRTQLLTMKQTLSHHDFYPKPLNVQAALIELDGIMHDIVKPNFPSVTSVHVDTQLPEDYIHGQVVISPDVMRVIIRNLVGNAHKYAGDELNPASLQVVTAIQHTKEGEAQGITIEVSDNGFGITEEELPRVFDLNAGKGTGFGLFQVRRFVTELLGGEINVHSNGPGTGTTFTLFLPFAESQGE